MNPALRPPIIRIAMLTGVLIFGAVAWLTHRDPAWSADPDLDRAGLHLMVRIEWAIALVGMLVLFLAYRRARTPQQAMNLSIIAWAVGEATALLGGVYYLLLNDTTWYALGLSFLVLAFVAFPARLRR